MVIKLDVLSVARTEVNTNGSKNNNSAFSANISEIKNNNMTISLPTINKPNTEIYMMKIGNDTLKSHINNISSFNDQNLSFPKELVDKFSESKSVDNITNKQDKLRNVNIGKKVGIPELNDKQLSILSNKQLSALSNEKTESKTITSQNELSDNENKIEYEKIQDRYELNSNKFSQVLNAIKNDKISNQEKENKLKAYLLSNDPSMKKIGTFERFKNIFGKSNKINTIRNEQHKHAKIILDNLNKTIMDENTSQKNIK